MQKIDQEYFIRIKIEVIWSKTAQKIGKSRNVSSNELFWTFNRSFWAFGFRQFQN